MSSQEVPKEFVRALQELGLTNSTALQGSPLTGGVSSDIWCVETEHGFVCAKRALSKLRVAADWRAPVERNLYEARWLQVAQMAFAGCAPELLGQHKELGVLVMRYLPPSDFRLWKKELHAGRVDITTAKELGEILASIHSYAAKRPEMAKEFPTEKIFYEIRLAPYLIATAERHPHLANALHALVAQTQDNAKTLVHGDVSPKIFC
jgi:fructosamine-3-kinase